MSLYIHFVYNGDMKGDGNGARLPVWLDHRSALVFSGDFLPGGRQTCAINIYFILIGWSKHLSIKVQRHCCCKFISCVGEGKKTVFKFGFSVWLHGFGLDIQIKWLKITNSSECMQPHKSPQNKSSVSELPRGTSWLIAHAASLRVAPVHSS